jgi:hypothetical protein
MTLLKSTTNVETLNCPTSPNQPKSQILFYKKRPLQDLHTITLDTTDLNRVFHESVIFHLSHDEVFLNSVTVSELDLNMLRACLKVKNEDRFYR